MFRTRQREVANSTSFNHFFQCLSGTAFASVLRAGEMNELLCKYLCHGDCCTASIETNVCADKMHLMETSSAGHSKTRNVLISNPGCSYRNGTGQYSANRAVIFVATLGKHNLIAVGIANDNHTDSLAFHHILRRDACLRKYL